MSVLKRIHGGFLNGLATVIHGLFSGLIFIVDGVVGLIVAIGRGFGALISMGGCLLFFLFMGPLLSFLPLILPIVILMVLVIFLGRKFVSFLKYYQYAVTEYLYDKAEYYKTGKSRGYDDIGSYGAKYRRMEEEAQRARWREQREQEQKQWEEQFRQWYEYQRRAQQGGQYQRGAYGGTGGRQAYQDPRIDFKAKFEKSCDILGVPYDADEYQIKLAYRKKAKEYHPDINKAPDATERFQEINDAYGFLSPENIQRYKSLVGK